MRINFLDGLRAVAIILVIFAHFHMLPSVLARFSVTLFFFLSGLLITQLLLKEKEVNGTVKLGEFYLRRAFRLYPALLFMVICMLLILLPAGYGITLTDVSAAVFYWENYLIVHGQSAPPFHVLWSLAVEEHFYLLFPLVVVQRKNILPVLVFIIAISPLVRLLNIQGLSPEEYHSANYFPSHTRADSILWGCLSAVLLNKQWYIKILQKKWSLFAGLAGSVLAFSGPELFKATLGYTLTGMSLMLAVPCFFYAYSKGFFYRCLDNPAMIFIGKISYSLYLFHWVAKHTANLFFMSSPLWWYLTVIPMTIILSLISYYFVESPFLKYRKQIICRLQFAGRKYILKNSFPASPDLKPASTLDSERAQKNHLEAV